MELGVSHLTSLFFLLPMWEIIITKVIIKSLKTQCGNVLDMTWGSGEQRESGLCCSCRNVAAERRSAGGRARRQMVAPGVSVYPSVK